MSNRKRTSSNGESLTTSEALLRLFDGGLPGLPSARQSELGAFVTGYNPPERLAVSEFADRHRILKGTSASEPGPWKTDKTPYLREIMDNLSIGSDVWIQAFIAGAQVGKTESGLNWLAYIMGNAPGPTLFVAPKADLAKSIIEERVGRMIESMPILLGRVTKKNLRTIHFHGGVINSASAKSASDIRSRPCQYIYCDECDAFPDDVEGEGPPVNLAIARTRTFKSKRKVYLTSTPTKEATSIIWAHWLLGDMRLYHVPCPKCQNSIVLEFEGLKWEWGRAKETIYYLCPSCDHHIQEFDKITMLPQGKWIPTRKDLENVEDGRRSYRLPSLYSPLGWYSWDEIASKFENIYNNPSKLAEFRNVDLGLPSMEVSEKVDWETVYTRGDVGDPYNMTPNGTVVPKGVLFLTAGMDVGQDHIEMSVWGWGRDRRRWLIDHVRIYGKTHQSIQEAEVWDDATLAVHRTYRNIDGVEMGIRRVFIDTGYIPEVVRPWIRKQNQNVVMGCDGIDSLDEPVKVTQPPIPVLGAPGKTTKVGSIPIAQVGVSFLKGELMGLLTITRPEMTDDVPVGWVHMPRAGGAFTKEIAQ